MTYSCIKRSAFDRVLDEITSYLILKCFVFCMFFAKCNLRAVLHFAFKYFAFLCKNMRFLLSCKNFDMKMSIVHLTSGQTHIFQLDFTINMGRTIFNIRLLKAKNRAFEFDYKELNMSTSV